MNIVRAIVEHLDRHASYSEINRATGASKGFISKVAAAVEAASLTPEKFLLLNDEDIQNRITPGRPKRQIEPDWALIAGQMHSNRHLTLQLMWEAHRQVGRRRSIFLPVLLPALRQLAQRQRTCGRVH